MQTMFTGLPENGKIPTDTQNIRLIFWKVHNPIMNQIKKSLQVSYDMDQANTVIYDFIANSLAAEAAGLGYQKPQLVAYVNTRGKNSPESGVKRSGGAIFTGFYPNRSNLSDGDNKYVFNKSEWLNIKAGWLCKYFENKNRAELHPSNKKESGSEDPTRDLIF